MSAAGAAAMQGRRRVASSGVEYLLDYADSTNTRSTFAAYQDPRDGWAFVETGYREDEATWPALSSWTDLGTPGETTGVADPFGGTGAVTTEDNDTGAYEGHRYDVSSAVSVGQRFRLRIYVKKDAVTSRFPEFQLLTTSQTLNVQINTSTGAVTTRTHTGFRAVETSAETAPEDAEWWLLTIAATSIFAGNLRITVYAAVSTVWGGTEIAATGSVTWYPRIELQGHAAYKRATESRIYPSDGAMLSEGGRTNSITDSINPNNLTKFGTTVTAYAHTAPDGSPHGATLTFAASAGYYVGETITATADGETWTLSVWAKVSSGTREFRLWCTQRDGSTVVNQAFTATAEWQRFSFTFSVGTGASDPMFRIQNAASGGAGDLHVFNLQGEKGAFASSDIPTVGATQTRMVDAVSAANAFLLAVHNSRHAWDVWPLYPSSELAAGASSRRTWAQGGGNVGHMHRGVAGGCRSSVITAGGGPASDVAVTFDPLQELTNVIDLTIVGETTRSGYTTGNGTTSFAAQAALSPSGNTLFIGHGAAIGGSPAFEVISRPRAA